jgi:hypothetical protein
MVGPVAETSQGEGGNGRQTAGRADRDGRSGRTGTAGADWEETAGRRPAGRTGTDGLGGLERPVTVRQNHCSSKSRCRNAQAQSENRTSKLAKKRGGLAKQSVFVAKM